ncbi:MAG: type II toxin-antitoxin system RelE family toxin [Minisyncoccota bacterium]
MARLFFTIGAERDYQKLPTEVQTRISFVLDGRFAIDPFASEFNTTKLKPPLRGYRLRVGDYRILFEFSPNVITVHKIRHRKDAYR